MSNKSKLEFIGLDTQYKSAKGAIITRTHLDGAASPLACATSIEAISRLLPHYSNTHSYVHNSAKVSTKALNWAHSQILRFVGASNESYTSIFTGAGTTAAINRLARGLKASRPQKPVILVSAMEHHANDLPHRQFGNQVKFIPLQGEGSQQGSVDMLEYEKLLKDHKTQINYVAVSSVSNVTGIKNPVREMATLAHEYGAKIIVDGAQSVAHERTILDDSNIDFFIFSGHKLYTPMSPGVLIADKKAMEELGGQDLGGGSVSSVSYFDYELLPSYPAREQSGTPNIVGAIALASVSKVLLETGMDELRKSETEIMAHLFSRLNDNENIRVYGDHLLARTGALAFNHSLIDHGLLAAILNDYYGIAVRNECFCAHPYVSSLLKEELWELDLDGVDEDEQEDFINRKRGMVRVSISAYNTKLDIDRLMSAIEDIEGNINELKTHYLVQPDGSYTHNNYEINWETVVLSH